MKKIALLIVLVLAGSPLGLVGCSQRPARPVVAVVKGSDRGQMIAEAIRLAGGLDIRDGQKVVLKPNLTGLRRGEYYPGMTTDARVVQGVIDSIDARARCDVTVAEAGGGNMTKIFPACGYDKLTSQHGQVHLVDSAKDRRAKLPVPATQRAYDFPLVVKEADYFINVPVLKTHQLTGASLGFKNLYGLLNNNDRRNSHDKIDLVLSDMASIRKVDFVVVDGLVGMEGQGPLDGKSVAMNVVVAGKDPVAVDAVCAEIMGISPRRLTHLQEAQRRGLGVADLDRIEVRGARIDDVQRMFIPAFWWMEWSMPADNAMYEKIVKLADARSDNYHQPLIFYPGRLKIDQKKYPNLRPFAFYARAEGKHIRFVMRIIPYYHEYIQATDDGLKLWVAENFGTQAAARLKMDRVR